MGDQFDRLYKRNAFLDQYKKERVFENSLDEFEDARYVKRFAQSIHTDDSQSNLRRSAQGVQGLRESRLYLICEHPFTASSTNETDDLFKGNPDSEET